MDLQSQQILIPMHIYEPGVELWKYYAKLKDFVIAFKDIMDDFQKKYESSKKSGKPIDGFDIKRCTMFPFNRRTTNVILLKYTIYQVFEPNCISERHSYDRLVGQVNAIGMDYLGNIKSIAESRHGKLVELTTKYDRIARNPDAEVTSPCYAFVSYKDYKELETLSEQAGQLSSDIQSLMDRIDMFSEDRDIHDAFHDYFRDMMLMAFNTYVYMSTDKRLLYDTETENAYYH